MPLVALSTGCDGMACSSLKPAAHGPVRAGDVPRCGPVDLHQTVTNQFTIIPDNFVRLLRLLTRLDSP